jgi:guanylate kinase
MSFNGKCIIVSAPSGAGKTTIVRHLINSGLPLGFSVSATSRSPRDYEKDGVHYVFLSADTFSEKIRSGDFIEWEEVYEKQYYGTLKSEIERVWGQNKHLIFDVDVKGGLALKSHFGENALAIFIEPPSIAELENRLKKRGTESADSLAQRVGKAEEEIALKDGFDKVVVNDDLELACKEATLMITEFIKDTEG